MDRDPPAKTGDTGLITGLEDSTRCGATTEPQLLSPAAGEPTAERGPSRAAKDSPGSPQLEEAARSNEALARPCREREA